MDSSLGPLTLQSDFASLALFVTFLNAGLVNNLSDSDPDLQQLLF
jgi:hypothetical protein